MFFLANEEKSEMTDMPRKSGRSFYLEICIKVRGKC